MNITEIILDKAEADRGKKELKGNSGWEDKVMQARMELAGWQDGQSWCAYWTEDRWCAAYEDYRPEEVKLLRKLFSANAVATFMGFQQSKFITSNKPLPGSVAIWMKMKNGRPSYVGDTTWIRGHAAIVLSQGNVDYSLVDTFPTLEGNGNSSGGREGIEVAGLVRKIDFKTNNGLRLMGFVNPLT